MATPLHMDSTDCSAHGDSILSLSYSSSPFENYEDGDSVPESDHSMPVEPYQYEPEKDSDSRENEVSARARRQTRQHGMVSAPSCYCVAKRSSEQACYMNSAFL